MTKLLYAIGLMSGTSMDGIDATLIQSDGEYNLNILDAISTTYNRLTHYAFKSLEYAASKAQGDIQYAKYKYKDYLSSYLAEIESEYTSKDIEDFTQSYTLTKNNLFEQIIEISTLFHLNITQELIKRNPNVNIDVIGYHGQTLFHAPEKKLSIQAGYPQKIADQTGIKVVSDLRSKDLAVGGQGAPIVPVYHFALLQQSNNNLPTIVANCGGIANISIIRNSNILEMLAYDAGPGNCLIDKYVKYKTQGQETMDQDGKYAIKGKIDNHVLNLLYKQAIGAHKHDFFKKKYAKSLDVNDFVFIDALKKLKLADGCATLIEFTTEILANSIINAIDEAPKQIILCGGGWNHPLLKSSFINKINQQFGPIIINQDFYIEDIKIDSKFIEAQAIAYIAIRSLLNLPVTFPNTTAAKQPISAGIVHHLFNT